MMGELPKESGTLFYDFDLEKFVAEDHLLRRIDQFLDFEPIRSHLAPYYSRIGRPSVDPELMLRMLIVGYCYGIRSERQLCEDVQYHLAYRWFCRLGLEGKVPNHSTFTKNRYGRFKDSDVLRHLFEFVLEQCMAAELVGAEGFAVDASLIHADARGLASVAGGNRLTGAMRRRRGGRCGSIWRRWMQRRRNRPTQKWWRLSRRAGSH